MKLSEKQESILLYSVVFILITINIYFQQWGLALALMLMIFFIEIVPLFTRRRVEEFSYTKLAEALSQHRSEAIKAERGQAQSNASVGVEESKPINKQESKNNKKSEAAAMALAVGKTLAKNDRVKALGKMALNTAADKIEQEVKEQLKSDKKSKDEEDSNSEREQLK